MIEKEYLENAIPGIFIASHGKDFEKCKIEYANPSLIKLFGRDLKGECIIKPDYWVKPEMRSVYLDMLERDEKVDGIEAELRRADGSIFWGKLYSRYIGIQNTGWLQGTIIDISKEKLEEQMLLLFEAGIEHDWKNYLTGIRAYSQILEMGQNISKDQQNFIRKIIVAVDNLGKGMEEKLEFSKAYSGRLPINKKNNNLYNIIFEAAVRFWDLAEREGKKIRIVGIELKGFESQSRDAVVGFDYNLFGKVMSNLLSNGLKYAGEIDINIYLQLNFRLQVMY
jgi:PAS domain S-box-containing protein